jgi:hypothetical protein
MDVVFLPQALLDPELLSSVDELLLADPAAQSFNHAAQDLVGLFGRAALLCQPQQQV